MFGRVGRNPIVPLGALLALYLIGPIGYFLYRLAASNDRGFHSPGLTAALATSAESASISTAVIALFGIPLAYWLARGRGPVVATLGVLVQLPLALPPVMSGIVLIYLVGPYTPLGTFFDGRLTDSLAGVVIAQTFVAAPFLIVAARSAFLDVEPALYDQAATLGHRPLGRFFRVAVPIAAQGIRAGLLLTWLRAVGEYGATVLLAYHPYTLPVFTSVQFASTGLPGTQAPTALALGLAVLALVLNQLRRPRRWRRATRLPPASPPSVVPATPVSFDLDLMVGDFRLRLAHDSSSQRLAILGASGSGKSVTLRALAGLYGASAGTVRYGEDVVSGEPTYARRVGYVPQGLGLVPGRTVWSQLRFSVGSDPGLGAWWLATLRLEGLVDRLPNELSGGQRQRVSIAQALARVPRVVLLDEPFSALDTPVRDELRRELRRLQRETGLSSVLVTHDPEEAALLADEIVVIADGRLLQAGPRRDVYSRPASPEVARLLGIQNVARGRQVTPGTLDVAGFTLATSGETIPAGTDVVWSVRPQHVHVVAPSGDLEPDGYPATVDDAVDVGTETELVLRITDELHLRARTSEAIDLAPGDVCRVRIDPDDIRLWAAT